MQYAICVFLLFLIPLLTGCGGCRGSATAPASGGREGTAVSSQFREDLLSFAVDNLNRLDEFGAARALPQIVQRLDSLNKPETAEPAARPETLLAVWPEPEMLLQIVDRLNQWIRPQQPSAGWKPDPMLAALPKPTAELPQVKNLGEMEFSRFDGFALQEAVWLRDVSRWARGEELDDLRQAAAIFDWTVRNIQLEADSPGRVPLFPWETLLFGRGTASERAWVFILLLRQLDIDAALLAIEEGREERGEGREEKAGEEEGKGEPSAETETPERGLGTSVPSGSGDNGNLPSSEAPPEKPLRPWCVGALIEGQVYLFDPLLGLPIPGPDGVSHGESGQLSIRPATLAEVRADGKLLERMNLDEARTYGVKASDLDRVAVLLEASPAYLSCRMKMLEARLAGERKLVLSASPSSDARRWKETAGLSGARLWQRPFETLLARSNLDRRQVQSRLIALLPYYVIPSAPLYRGRMLHLKGNLVGDEGAMKFYQAARPSNAELDASSLDQIEKAMLRLGKIDATYWCGLISFQRGDYAAAVDYFMKRTLEVHPDGPWTGGARYNLARAYEATGQIERAILAYGLDSASPGYFGNLLRAKWLSE